LAGLIVLSLALAGCDSCGHFHNINVPSLPKSCHADPPPAD
jgi:hypothetical protein